MQTKIFALTAILSFCLSSAPAQKKSRTAAAPAAKASAAQLMEEYKFSDAAAAITREIQAARRKQKATDSLETELQRANLGENMLQSTEQVVVIDSIVVDRDKVLSVMHISPDAGRLGSPSSLANSLPASGYAYMPQLGDKIFYDCAQKDGTRRLCVRDRLDDSWGEEHTVSGLDDFGSDQTSPYMLSDGETLYFAAKGDESLGGYDIFMTRYSQEQGKFLKPENIGMPFSSTANDYLFAIDETNNLGWFVSDRRQPEGKVCIYVFIPNDTRKSLNTDDPAALAGYARISSISSTQAGSETDVKAALKRLENAFKPQELETVSKGDFTLVIDDSRTYTSLSDFKQKEARTHAAAWAEATKKLAALSASLSADRDAYAAADDKEKAALKSKILKEEQQAENLETKIKQLEKQIRREEKK